MSEEEVTPYGEPANGGASSSAFGHSRELNELAAALAKAQGEIQTVGKNAENPFGHYNYADLGAVMKALREPLSKHGLAVVQGPFTSEGGFVIVRTRLIHTSGQWIECCVQAEATGTDPQAVGSVITYLRRYSLAAMTGVATEDDDGEAATSQAGKDAAQNKGQAQSPRRKPTPAQAQQTKACPKCGAPLRVSRHGEDYYCWKKRGGCGATFPLDFETAPELSPEADERYSEDIPI